MTLAQLRLAWSRLVRKMRFRATVYGLLGVAAALLGALLKPVIPERLAGAIGADSVGNLLTILASSMLAVTTFSLSIMVAAYASAANGATPRASRLLIADSSAQGALATFIGAFLFSVVGLIALSTGVYGDSGRVVLFVATVLVIGLIALTLLRWIDQLSSFGRLGATVNLVESVTRAAMRAYLGDPWMGAAPGGGVPPAGSLVIEPARVGYIQHVDVERLSTLAAAFGGVVHVAARPGVFATPGRPLAWIEGGDPDDELPARVRAAFTIGGERSFDQDPRFGFVVLTEIGSRALSPATNDAGTAIDVIGTVTRLLCEWAGTAPVAPAARHARVFMPAIEVEDVFDDVFPLLARDGAGMLEVGIRLQKCLGAIAACGDPAFTASAKRHGAMALARGLAALTFEADRAALRDALPHVAGAG